jgi:hypothetical protein
MGGKIPVGDGAQLLTDKLDPAREVDSQKESDVIFAADYEGVTVFAVQYRRLKSVKAGGISLEDAKKLGPGVRLAFDKDDKASIDNRYPRAIIGNNR